MVIFTGDHRLIYLIDKEVDNQVYEDEEPDVPLWLVAVICGGTLLVLLLSLGGVIHL